MIRIVEGHAERFSQIHVILHAAGIRDLVHELDRYWGRQAERVSGFAAMMCRSRRQEVFFDDLLLPFQVSLSPMTTIVVKSGRKDVSIIICDIHNGEAVDGFRRCFAQSWIAFRKQAFLERAALQVAWALQFAGNSRSELRLQNGKRFARQRRMQFIVGQQLRGAVEILGQGPAPEKSPPAWIRWPRCHRALFETRCGRAIGCRRRTIGKAYRRPLACLRGFSDKLQALFLTRP